MQVVVEHHDPETQALAHLGGCRQRDQRREALLEVVCGDDHVEAGIFGPLDELDPLPARLRLCCLEAEAERPRRRRGGCHAAMMLQTRRGCLDVRSDSRSGCPLPPAQGLPAPVATTSKLSGCRTYSKY